MADEKRMRSPSSPTRSTHAGAAHRDRTDAGHDLAFRQMSVGAPAAAGHHRSACRHGC